jgi:hypothetical protein
MARKKAVKLYNPKHKPGAFALGGHQAQDAIKNEKYINSNRNLTTAEKA